MEESSDKNLVSTHLISDGTEDVVVLDSAATISADLTEVTNEDQKLNLRSAKEEDMDSSNVEDNSVVEDSSDEEDSADGNDDGADNDGKDESQNDRKRKHDFLSVSTGGTKCEFSRLVASTGCSAY